MRRKDTISYLGVWENLHNPDFKSIEFDAIKNASGSNRFILTAKEWIERTSAIGIIAKSGRYGGTYAHKDIAYHFGMWLSPEFNLPLVELTLPKDSNIYAAQYSLYLPDKAVLQRKLKEWIEEYNDNEQQ